MLTLLSPAKKLNFEPASTQLDFTMPVLKADTAELAKVAKQQSANDLKRLMHISDKLAALNADRFKAFNLDGQSNSAKAASLAFDGDVYWGLDANSLSDDTLRYAQDHLRILSGLYGVLRPLDAIQPYRLEMGTKLKTKRGGTLYEFWGDIIADELLSALEGHKDQAIINLASNEYVKAAPKAKLEAASGRPMISAKFLNVKEGKARALMYYAKHARGQMARWIMENRVDRAEGLKDFNLGDYSYDKSASSETELVFTRPQPAPKK
jgi:cytoplasmic iron level regulating protein YaaA (DUF328/UPF0246 family)